MKKTVKKIIALLLVSVMLTALAACATKKDNGTSTAKGRHLHTNPLWLPSVS